MKKLLIIVLLLQSIIGAAQSLMTIGEVFDFDVNDEFHYFNMNGEYPPNGDRVTITYKHVSIGLDTIVYGRFHDKYSSEVIWDPTPHLEYTFWTFSDILTIVNPQLNINNYDSGFQLDSLVHFDTCGTELNTYEYYTGVFEPDFFERTYGQGLGWTYDYFYSTSDLENPFIEWKMVYYSKATGSCGNPDNIAVGINESFNDLIFSIYPVPCEEHLTINNPYSNITLTLMNLNGKTIFKEEFNSKKIKINMDKYDSGVYILNIQNNNKIISKKVLKI